jgi:hypothetical protein
LGFWQPLSRRAWQSTPARRSVLLDTIDHAEHVGRNHGDLTSGLDYARAADQSFAYSRRQQVQFVFRRQRRLPP